MAALEEIVRLAIHAGNDILLFGNDLEYEYGLQVRAFRASMTLVESGGGPGEDVRGGASKG